MNMSVLARSTVGIAATVAMGVATIVSATTASAQMSITTSTAYCVGSTYTLTLPAADASALIAQVPGGDVIGFSWVRTASQGGGALDLFTSSPYVAGKDASVQWTPTTAETVDLWATAGSTANGYTWSASSKLIGITVVQSAPSGASCTPSTSGTGSASSIPVIGGLLSTLSAQK
ncbi:hypothetical protein [Nocardia tengchongensis]